jgi:very-short-patch-repair endonuclease
MNLATSTRIPLLYTRARRLRSEMTPAERILWKRLRNRRFANAKFRRQHPIDWYVADFFCAAARLVIELDGDSHMGKEERDTRRQAYIESHDIRVIRFWNVEVYDELGWVLDCIALALDQALPSADGPPAATSHPKPR